MSYEVMDVKCGRVMRERYRHLILGILGVLFLVALSGACLPTASPTPTGDKAPCPKEGPEPKGMPQILGSLTITARVESVVSQTLLRVAGSQLESGAAAGITEVTIKPNTRLIRADLCPMSVQDLKPGMLIQVNGEPVNKTSVAALQILLME